MRLIPALLPLAIGTIFLSGCSGTPDVDIIKDEIDRQFMGCALANIDVVKLNGMKTGTNQYSLETSITIAKGMGHSQEDIMKRRARLDELRAQSLNYLNQIQLMILDAKWDPKKPYEPQFNAEKQKVWDRLQEESRPIYKEKNDLENVYTVTVDSMCGTQPGRFLDIYSDLLDARVKHNPYGNEIWGLRTPIQFNAVVDIIKTEEGWMIGSVREGTLASK